MGFQKKTAALLLCLCAAVLFFAGYSYNAITAAAPSFERLEELPTIVIDAGHGGFDGGATGVDGIVEKDVNLSIARKLGDLFTISGFHTVLTRESDRALDDQGLSGIRQRKNSDIHNRAALAASYPNCILISIHQNKFQESKYFGAQVFYGPKNASSQALGEIMQRRLVGMLQPENIRKCKPCGDNVYLIYHAQMPSLLVECGFLSNPQDAYKLIDSGYQQRVAFTVFSGVMEYLGLELNPAKAELPEQST